MTNAALSLLPLLGLVSTTVGAIMIGLALVLSRTRAALAGPAPWALWAGLGGIVLGVLLQLVGYADGLAASTLLLVGSAASAVHVVVPRSSPGG